jgi:hypothetical protein
MNKKILFLAAGMVMASASFAQKEKLKEAGKELEKAITAKEKNDGAAEIAAYQKAKEAIDAAVNDPTTKDNGKTWFTKAAIYMGMQENQQLNADHPYKEGISALKKAFELDQKLQSEEKVPNMLANGAFYYYNQGIQTYNNSKYGEAYNLFKSGAELLGQDKDKRFALIPVVDTIRAQSKMFMGYTSFYDEKFDVAVPLLNEAKGSPYLTGQTDIYIVLSQAYEKQGKSAEQLAVLQEAKAKFPGDKNIANAEINYFITSGKQDEVTKKLEEEIAKDPSNPELQINLGIIYAGMARPSGGAAPPANAAELHAKAEAAYKKAAELAPENATYQYQLGAYYFNQAADLNTVMNNLGTGKADQQKYNQLLVQRNALFTQALPLLEKSRSLFASRENKLKGEENKYYFDSLTALKEIYTIQDQLDKAKEIREKMNSMK